MNVPPNGVQRKPAGRQTVESTNQQAGQLPNRHTQNQIEEHALNLLAERKPAREFSEIIARRLGVTEAAVDLVLAMRLAEYRSEATTLRLGVQNALTMATEARRRVAEAA